MFQFGEAWSFVWGGLTPPKPLRGDGTELKLMHSKQRHHCTRIKSSAVLKIKGFCAKCVAKQPSNTLPGTGVENRTYHILRDRFCSGPEGV